MMCSAKTGVTSELKGPASAFFSDRFLTQEQYQITDGLSYKQESYHNFLAAITFYLENEHSNLYSRLL